MSNPVQERHLESLCGQLHSLHCGYTSQEHDWKVHHSVDELELGHVIVQELLDLVAAWSRGRTNRRAVPGTPPAPPRPRPPSTIREPTLRLPGAALDRCNNDRRIALYRALGSAGAWVTLPKEVTLDGQVLRAATP